MTRPSYSDVQVRDPGRPTPPRTPYEEVVHGIWRDVLSDVVGAVDFGVHDDFFELGGHSLAAPRIVARIRKTLGVQVAVRDFFGCRTVAALASVVAAQSSAGPQVIERRPPDAEAVLSFDQQRIWLENQLQPSLAYNVHGRQRLVGPLDVAALEASIRAVVRRHEALRTRFPLVDGRPVQVVDDLGDAPLIDVEDLREVADPAGRAAELADAQANTVFDLTAGGLLRCLLLRTGDTRWVLSLTAHHIICDDWSIGLFMRELSALYAAGGDAAKAGLPPLPIQYGDYAAWQRDRLTGETLDTTVAYWRDHLAGAPPVLTMPVTRRQDGDRERGEWTRGRLSADETAALHMLCRTHGVSPFMVAMATFATVLARWSGQRDVVIGVPNAGRNDAGTDTLIGFLVNTLPIRVDLTGEPTFADLLTRVRQVCLDGYAHADAPLDVLVRRLDLTRDTRHTPLFQVVLSMLSTSASTVSLPGLTVESMDGATALPTKLDLTLNVQESDQRLHFQLDYNPERYDRSMVEALATQLEALLRAAVADPARSILDYPLGPAPAGEAADAIALTADDRVTALTGSPGLAAYARATAGGALYEPPPFGTADVSAWLRETGVTAAFLSSPALRALAGPLPDLRLAVVENTGELLGHDLDTLRRLAPQCRIVCVYGVTDGRPLTTYEAAAGPASARVPLGQDPVPLVNPAGRPAAVGEVAVLPTGDLARRGPDGTLEYVAGGPDPVETVAALRELPEVREALVLAECAYVTVGEPARHGSELRQDLLLRLPDYLTPRHVVVLDALPRTPAGDYDLAALPEPTGSAPAAPVPPRTPYEEAVHGIWCDVLGETDFGVHDDFFELGGHSLLAPRIVNRIRETLGVQIAVGDFFGCRTVAALASVVAAQSSAGPQVIERRPPDAEAVLSFDQQRIWLENQLQPSLAYNVHGRQRLTGPLDVAAFEASVRAILERHEALRTRFPLVDGRPVQVVDDLDPGWRLAVTDVSGDAEPMARAGRLADEQATTPFELAAGSLFRCLLVKVGDDAHVLSLTAHHIVCDEWSIGLFARELSALYAAGGDPDRAGLRPLPIQYGDFAAWQRDRLTGETLDRTVAYWRDHLADVPPALTMPVAHEDVAAGTAGGRARAVLSEAETAAVADFCRTHGVSPFMVMMAGYATVLSRWSGQRDLVIGVPIAGRTDAGTDALIGFLLNTLPIRVDLTGEPTFADVLARVRRAALDGYAHSDAPLDVLVQQLDVNRDPRRTPLFQAVLNVVGDTPTAELAGLVVESFDSPAALPSKFDLSLNVQESRRRTWFQLDYNPARYEPAMVEAVLDQVAGLIRTVVTDPTRGILDYPLGPTGQVETPLATVVERPEPAPERSAVVDVEGEHSYAWLDGAIAAVGERLEPDGHVGLVRRPTAWFVAALLHRLRTGGAYSVIDPELALAPSYLGVTSVLDVADHPAEPAAAHGLALDAIRRHAWAVDRHGLTADDRFAALTHHPGHLVAAVTHAVAAGGTLVLTAEPDDAVTVLFLSPPQLRALREPLPALRYAFVAHAGDLLPHDIARLRKLAPACRVVAAYRPDRDGRPLASYLVPDGWEPGTAPLRVPLGTGAVELRNATGQPAAVGEAAELHAGDRRTGDLVRRWADGTLEYVGEVDANPAHDPVRTVRALRELPDVTDAVVTEWADTDGNPVLVGYLAGPDPERDTATVRQLLIPRLPRYLLPAHLFVLDVIPRTPDGDYDLDALPEPDEDDLGGDRYVAPRTPVERRLAEIFEELLGLGRIGVHDSFFELNGFSLLATQMTSRVREAFQVELPLREVFGSPTVEGVAQLILWKQSEQSDAATLEAMLAEIEAEE
ncbi:hypothetical protein Ais01nite_08520 [Asanoa ishikariensis]|uniref:condensation domain-containing protein n=1 Tax=Asanoa ishikariensis TaxID=137265 RepID=UPI00194DFA15|nr:condensation domain-containing protein [Asanoa ishikariensis]GIF62817.1 hypothetical protein Ais01nite_08520 [Asanoa ishikariensis]